MKKTTNSIKLQQFRNQLLKLQEQYASLWKKLVTFNQFTTDFRKLATEFKEFSNSLIKNKTTSTASDTATVTKLTADFKSFDHKLNTNFNQIQVFAQLQAALKTQKQEYLAKIDNQHKYWEQLMQHEKLHLQKKLFQEILQIVDLLELSLRFKPQHAETINFFEGIKMTYKLFDNFLHQFGVKPMEVKPGQTYDYHNHHAISTCWKSAQPLNVIVEIKQRGYWFNDQVLRVAQVVINQPPKPKPNLTKSQKKDKLKGKSKNE